MKILYFLIYQEAIGKISLTKEDEEKLNEIKRSGVIRQWVHKVTDFSSQYDAVSTTKINS